ncbi:MAG: hypothetical protein AAF745_14775, partial [Planctomycetota bacterium]
MVPLNFRTDSRLPVGWASVAPFLFQPTQGCNVMTIAAPQANVSTSTRFDASDKRLINCNQVDVNQLMPLKYHWAWEHY